MLNHLLKILDNTNLFLTGSGGVGKSYMTSEIINKYRSKGLEVVVLGSTGISAVNIGGMTLHSFFKLGICKNHDELKAYDRKQKSALNELKQILKKCKLIVIDEISMVSAELFELIYYRLSSFEFGGKVMVVGDFYQLPPVAKKDEFKSNLFGGYYAFSSVAWTQLNFTYVEILGSKRAQDFKFNQMLANLRIGRLDDETIGYFETLNRGRIDENSLVLFGRNIDADRLNETRLTNIDAPLEISAGYLEIYSYDADQNKFDRWIKNLNILEELKLKVGAKVIFTTNKWGEYYNGEQGVIKDIIKEDGQISKLVVQKTNQNVINVSKNSYDMSEVMMQDGELKDVILASYYQFPLKLAYAITIHKSQGMSIDNLVCELNNIFAKGQLYVALSRAINPLNLSIVYTKSTKFSDYLKRVVGVDEEVRNFYENEPFIYLEN